MRFALPLLAALLFCSSAWSQRLLTTPDLASFSPALHYPWDALVSEIVPVPGGGHVVRGRFEVWYEGKQFVDLLRLKANGEPDTDWQILANSNISAVLPTPYGAVLSGNFTYLNGSPVTAPVLVSSMGFGLVSLANLPNVISVVGTAYDPASGLIYVVTRMKDLTTHHVRRYDPRTGQWDTQWRFQLPDIPSSAPEGGIRVDDKGGLWVVWLYTDSCYLGCPTRKTARFSIAEPGRQLVDNVPTQWQRLPVLSGDYAYLDEYRYRIDTGAKDIAWKSAAPVHFADKDAIYYRTYETGSTTPPVAEGIVYRRAPTSGTGAPDDWIFHTLVVPTAGERQEWSVGALVNWPMPNGQDEKVAPAWVRRNGMSSYNAMMDRQSATTNPELSVVEYYLPALKHYFITGRKNEQDQLDALPQSFQRTGMTFAAKTSKYRDIPEQPVCRMYFPPSNGGSNTHFYGVGMDCRDLNKLGGMKYEGYDFSVLKPVNGSCPAAAPHPVTRLYNNKAAANDSNHRYVVATTTKARMLAQGWLDEGPVFCSSSVTDAAN